MVLLVKGTVRPADWRFQCPSIPTTVLYISNAEQGGGKEQVVCVCVWTNRAELISFSVRKSIHLGDGEMTALVLVVSWSVWRLTTGRKEGDGEKEAGAFYSTIRVVV